MSMAKEKEFENNACIMTEEEAENKPSQQGLECSLVSTDATGDAIQVCEKLVLKPYRIALKGLGWLSIFEPNSVKACCVSQSVVVCIFLFLIGTTFVTQGILCFQRDLLLLTVESCVNNSALDQNLICCKQHIISAFAVPDFLLIASYLFGIYLFSRAETEYLSNLAAKVFIKSVEANAKPPIRLVYTIGIYFLAGLAWIVVSVVTRIIYLVAFSLWQPYISIYWSDSIRITGSAKQGLIVAAIIGFVIFDVVYIASLMNYAIQSEMNIYLLQAIAKLTKDKKYNSFDESIKDINEADTYVHVLNGKTAAGTSLVIFNLSISAVVSLQQLNQIQTTTDSAALARFSGPLSVSVALLNAVLWISFVAFAFVQASRVTDACKGLQSCGPHVRARPFQYTTAPQPDLDSFVLYSHASKLRAKLFGIPIFPWMVYLAAVLLPFTIIVLVKTNTYKLFTHF
ncbi:hypothetical protein EMCRGX_G012066 [Ephydatia muelleri]